MTEGPISTPFSRPSLTPFFLIFTATRRAHLRKMKNRGAWTADEDRKLADMIEIFGPKRWKSLAAKAGLKRCGKSCRLRWMNYLRPNIKRGNISDQEEDLILRLHRLLGNRWSLIAGRLPGRTDNEIKNYWNSHLSKKIKQEAGPRNPTRKTRNKRTAFGGEARRSNDSESTEKAEVKETNKEEEGISKESSFDEEEEEESELNFNVDDFFDFSNENPSNLEWVTRFLEPDQKKS